MTEQIDQIVAARATGRTYDSIAKELGVSRQYIYKVVKQNAPHLMGRKGVRLDPA